jgi:hypothetical protein
MSEILALMTSDRAQQLTVELAASRFSLALSRI